MLRAGLTWVQSHRMRLGLATAAGLLYAGGFCGSGQFYLAWVCFVPALWAIDDRAQSGKEALVTGWTVGFFLQLASLPWIIGTLHDFGHLPWVGALCCYVLLCLAQGSLYAVWGWGLHWLSVRGTAPLLWSAPVLLVLGEWLYPAVFPTYLANSQYRQIFFIQSLDLWGPLGLTFVMSFTSAVIYQTLRWLAARDRPFPGWGWVTAVLVGAGNLAYGVAAVANIDDTVAHAERRLTVGLVQANIGTLQKHQNPRDGLRRYQEQTAEVERLGAELIVWPEMAYPSAIPDGSLSLANDVFGDLFDTLGRPLLVGALRSTGRKDEENGEYEQRKYYNSAVLTDANGTILGHYDKNRLVPFAEHIPFGHLLPSGYDLFPHLPGPFSPGTSAAPLVLGEIRLGMLICYEDIFPHLARRLMAHHPDVLVNLTNDAWFGRSREPLVHLALATFRAVEHRRYLIRSTNTGISAFVDPAGRIVSQTPVFARANLVGKVTPLQIRTVYAAVGDWVGFVCLAAALLWNRRGLQSLLVGVWYTARARRRRLRD